MQDPLELDRILLERCDEAGLPALRAGEDEVQCQQRLSDSRGPGDQRRCAAPVAVGEHRVERGHSRGHALRSLAVTGLVDRIGQPWIYVNTLAGQAIRVLAGQESTAPQLENLQYPALALGAAVGAQRQDGVGDGELGRIRGEGGVVLPDPERTDRQGRQPAGQFVQEAAQGFRIRRVVLQRLETVDHHQARTSLFDQLNDAGQHTGQAVVVQLLAKVFVHDAGAQRGCVEIVERLAEAQHLLEWLGDRGQVEGRAVGRGVMEEILLGENRLAGSRPPDDQGDAVTRQATAEHGVETIGAACESVGHRIDSGAARRRRYALVPSRSRTVETNCSGSSGFCKNASTPASNA